SMNMDGTVVIGEGEKDEAVIRKDSGRVPHPQSHHQKDLLIQRQALRRDNKDQVKIQFHN
ncbi:MAG: hypothetical protein WCS37_16235, partial [Chloroflexota bacterium]